MSGQDHNRVVLAQGQGRYKSITVELGRLDAEFAEIRSGLKAGEQSGDIGSISLGFQVSKTSDFKRMNHRTINDTAMDHSGMDHSGMVHSGLDHSGMNPFKYESIQV